MLLIVAPSAKTARMLIALALVGQIIFLFAADYMANSVIIIRAGFGIAYVVCATMQVKHLFMA